MPIRNLNKKFKHINMVKNIKKHNNKNGFTIIELIIVMVIMAILIGMTFLNLLPQNKLKEFNATVEKIVSLLNTARDKSKFQDSGWAWQVGLGNPFCSSSQLFFGLYDELNINTPKNKYTLPDNINFSSPNFNNSSSSCLSQYKKILIKFSASQGFLVGSSASATFSVFLKSNPNVSSTISVSPIGVVSFSTPSSSTPPYVPPLPDDISPTIPANLLAVPISSSRIDLSWSASTDNVGVAGYRIYRDGNPVPIATVFSPGYSNSGLSPSTTYTYTVDAYDARGNASGQSAPASATTEALALDTTRPAAIASLNVDIGGFAATQTDVSLASLFSSLAAGGGGSTGRVLLTWIAPGDDGNSGTATIYDLRYSTSPISILDSNWSSYSREMDLSLPQIAGSPETWTVSGLVIGTRYYFAIKAIDDAGNTSTISNIVFGTAQ